VARDYYATLGVSRTASSEDIQRAYRKLARQYHPDVNHDPGAEERFKEISEAYSVLSDPDTRGRYDRFGPDFRQVPEGYESYAGTTGAGGRVWVDSGPGRGFGAGGINIDDLFRDLFGSRGASGPMSGADQQAELELSVEDAYHGGTRRITLSGAGEPASFDVVIPPGVTDGQRIRLSGRGGQGSGGGAAGDLYLAVRIAPHPRYRVNGRDIAVDLLLSPWEAALGASVPVPTPGGEAKVRVPAGSSTGRRLRLRGEGMPNPRGTPGDLYAEVKIVMPRTLTPRERELFESLRKDSAFDPRRGT
jgi:curved DNA-binding protein